MLGEIAISSAVLGPAAILSAHGREAMNTLSAWTLHVLSENPDIDLATLPGTTATLALTSPPAPPLLHLPPRAAAYRNPPKDGHHYRLELEPLIAPLALRRGHRIFQ